MGCTVSRKDVKNMKVKIRFLPYKPREVQTELALDPDLKQSPLTHLKPLSKSDPLDTPLVLKPQPHYRSHSDFSRTTKNKNRGEKVVEAQAEAALPRADDFP